LLVRPEGSLTAQVRDSLEQTGSLMGGQGAREDGRLKEVWVVRAAGAGRVGLRVVP